MNSVLNTKKIVSISNKIHKGLFTAFIKLINFIDLYLFKYSKLSPIRRKANLILFAFLWVVIHSGIPALANPENGVVVEGSATINVDGKKLDVIQHTDKAVIDWRTFNIEIDEHTQFIQPNSGSLALNRVLTADPSYILGRLSANGNIILINPNGVFFGANSRVDVNGLIASTADINNSDFIQGRYNFMTPGNPNAIIRNDGLINAKEAGLVGLVAPVVENNGIISAKLGKVSLASGDTFTLDMYGDNLINVAVNGNIAKQAVKNTGTIEADGGRIALTAAAGRDIVDSLIEVKGELKAPAVAEKNGKIIIYAEGSNAVTDTTTKGIKTGKSTVLVDGKIDASGKGIGEKGGTVEIYGDQIGLLANAEIDTSGNVGGGDVNIGGDYQGLGDKPKAFATYVDQNATVNADAIENGNAGDVIFWSDDATRYYGTTYARGGSLGGNGGLVEVSGKNYLDFQGNVDTSAAVGETGNLLLDPGDINICLFGSSSLAACNPTGSPSLTAVGNIFDSGANATSYVNIGTTGTAGSLLNLLNANNVTVRTNAAGAGAGGGDITVHDAISIAAANTRTLTLQAHDKIFINAPITVRNLTLTANDLDIGAAINSNSAGNGTLTIQPFTASTTIGVGGGTGTLNIGDTDISNIQSGWLNVVVGSATGTGQMNVDSSSWLSHTTLQTQTGLLNVLGAQSLASTKNLTINTRNLTLGSTLSGTGTLTIRPDSNAITMGLGTGAVGTLSLDNTEIANIQDGWSLLSFGQTGSTSALNVNALTWSDNVQFNTATGLLTIAGNQTLGANNLTIQTGNLTIGANLSGSGTLAIRPDTNRTVGIGTGAVGVLNLDNTELGFIQDGWGQINLGLSSSTAAMNVNAFTWNDNVQFLTSTGLMTIAGNQTLGANNLTIQTRNLALNAQLAGSGTLTIQPEGNTTMGVGTGAAGTLSLDNTELGQIQDGWSQINLGSTANNQILTVAGRTWTDNIAFRTSSGAISITGDQVLGSNNLTFVGTGGLTLGGNITTSGTPLTFNRAVTLSGNRTIDAGNALISFTSTITGAGNSLTVNSTNAATNAINFGSTVSGVNVLDVNGKAQTNGNITTTGNMTFGNTLNLNANTTLNAGAGTISLKDVTANNRTLAFGGAGGLTLNGNITSTNTAITFNRAVTLAGNTSVNLGTAAATFSSTINGSNTLTLLGTGTKTFSGAVGGTTALTGLTVTGNTTLGGNITTNNGNVIFNNLVTLSGSRNISTGTGNITLSGISAGANTFTMTGTGGLNLKGAYTSTNTAFNFNRNVTLIGNTTTSSGTAATTFGGTVDGAFTLGTTTTTGGTVFSGVVGGTTPITSLTVSGPASFAGNVSTNNGVVSVSGLTTLTGSSLISTGTGNITLAGVTAGANTLTFAGTGGLTMSGNFTSTNTAFNFNRAVTLSNNTVVNSGTANTTFGSTVNGARTLSVTAGNTILSGAVGNTTGLTGLTITGPASVASNISTTNGAVSISGLATLTGSSLISTGTGNITLAGVAAGTNTLTLAGTGGLTMSGNFTSTNTAFNFNRAVTLSNNTVVNSGTATTTFGNTVNGARTLAITAGNTVFSSTVGNTTALTGLTITGPASLAGNVTLTNAALSISGLTTLTGNSTLSTGTGNITLAGVSAGTRTLVFSGTGGLTMSGNFTSTNTAMTFNRATTLSGATTVNLGTAAATFNSTIDGNNSLTLLGTGTKTFTGAVGGTTAIGALNVTGNTTLSNSVTTNNASITFNSPLTLGANSVINSGTATTTFSSTVNGARTLNVTAGNTVFGGAVGNTTALTGLTVTGPASIAGNVTLTNAALSVSGLTTLTGNSTLSTGTGNITLAGVAAGTNTLTLAGTGGLTMSGSFTSTNTAMTFNRVVTLAGATTVNTGTAATTFSSTIDGNTSLTLLGTGTKTFSGAVGGSTALTALTVTGNTTLGGNVTTNNGNVVFNNLVTLSGSRNINTGTGNITLSGITAAANTFTMTGTGGLNLTGNFTSTNTAFNFNRDATLTGATSVSTGSGAVTFKKIDGAQNLTVNTTGNITFSDSVGSTTRLGTVTITNANALSANSFKSGSFTQSAGTGTTNFAGTGLNTTNNISITSSGITGTYFGIGGQLHSGTGAINATTSFNTLNITGASANLLAGYIGSAGPATQSMANLISINNISHPNLTPNANFKFGGFTIGASTPSSNNNNSNTLPNTVIHEITNPDGDDENLEDDIIDNTAACDNNVEDSTSCRSLNKPPVVGF